MNKKITTLSASLLMATSMMAQATLTLHLDQASKDVSPTLYGLMTEEINYSYEGGLYAQLVRNPSFIEDRNGHQPNPWTPWSSGGPSFWTLTDTLSAQMSIDTQKWLNLANRQSLRLVTDGKTGIVNDGYWGYPIKPNAHFSGALFIATSEPQVGSKVEISLVGNKGQKVYATTTISITDTAWTRYTFSMETAKDVVATTDAQLRITPLQAGTYHLCRVTLFPETFNNRPNGLRCDLMKMMKDMHPKFLRFPGGNYLEGGDCRNRFDWKRTVGNPDNRPGHQSPWGYRSTDGMGLLEFLEWAEDVGAEPLLAVFAGYTLNGDYVTGDYVDGFVRDALDEIEYVTGGPETKWGAQRVRDGHPEPFPLHYVEIGNEDFFDESGSYPGRYMKFYNAIKERYPQLQIISTVDVKKIREDERKTGMSGTIIDIVDEHYYRDTEGMYKAAHQYDSYDRKGPKIFCGEWASREGKPTTNLNAALGDAAWMTGMERNSDIVIAQCYAPLLVNINPGGMQWESDLIGYNVLEAYGSPSYYAQCMFSNHLGNKIVPVDEKSLPNMTYKKSQLPQLYYSATTDTSNGKTYLKVVNGGSTAQAVRVVVDGKKLKSRGQLIVLSSAKPTDTNTIDSPRNIVPVTKKQKVGNDFTITFAPYSINVLTLEER
ncbi:MAG: alpha-L-arabinofuranosidase C-terminal domain-containing protein [Prevotella sp.]|jgi:alpha-N-arabinofuranosidase